MKPHIDFNRNKRTKSNNESYKNFFKLMNNAVYEKTMENLRKRVKIRIVKNDKDFIKYISKPTCVIWSIYDKRLAATHEKKIYLILNKPIYVGFTVLEISGKCIIFIINSLFNVVKIKLSDNDKLISRLNSKIKLIHDTSLECKKLIV